MNDDKRYLKRRRQGWYLAVDVPKELRATVGKVKIVLSLKTRDLKVAQARRWSALEHIKRTVEAARWELSARRQLYREAFRAALKELRELPPDDHSQEDPDEPWNSLPTTTDALADEAERLDERGDHGPRYQALLIALRERQGRPADIPERYLMTFSEAAREYLAEQRRDPYAGLTEQTVGQAEAVYRLFADHTGDPARCQGGPRDDHRVPRPGCPPEPDLGAIAGDQETDPR